jgi:hypothetical protein
MPHGDGHLPGDTESVARAGGLSIKQDHKLPVRTCDSVPGQTVEAIGGDEWTGRGSSCNLLIQHECFSPQSGENALGNQCGPAAFDSAIPRFESWRPSQQVVDLAPFLRSAPNAGEQRAFATSDVVCASQTGRKGVKFGVCLSGANLASVFVRENASAS